jgi:hypothetical protein
MTLLGTSLYVSLLLINSIAILNEERFLSRSASLAPAVQTSFELVANSRMVL